MIKWKQISSLVLATGMALSMAGCGGSTSETTASASPETSTETKTETKEEAVATETSEAVPKGVTIDQLTLGDNADLTATLKILTHRTDIVDTVFQDYVKQFNEIYPNITIQYEGTTDYAENILLRLTTNDWGQICMVPSNLDKDELPNYFESFGDLSTISEQYMFVNNREYENKVYGIPSTGNAQGIVYNKKVFEQAGITEMPKTPDEFLDALQKIKDNTDAVPMYSNFSAGWTMGAWDAYIGGSATGDADFMNVKLPHMKDPFSKRDDMTGPYSVYYVLYEATARGLIEDDPTTSDWEGCKGMINNGEIGTMVLGSWAVTQMQEAGPNPDDIGYMPFPITQPDGKQYASAGPDYCYGINVHATDEEKLASMYYIKWLTEESGFSYDQGGIPIQKGDEYPAIYDAFDGIDLIVDNPSPVGEETLFTDINNESEVGLNTDNTPDSAILEAALTGSKTLDEIMAEWNEKWAKGQEKYNAEIKY
ncbi:MAG: carbohydrate ABC transporter substrate-binding protein [Cellulosilyticum sp.]|nr:carbohydrate ABC transporter substrate-binding protein [Cellulosilyticum sp.]